MSKPYRMMECLQQYQAEQLDTTILENGIGMSSWYNQHALVDVDSPDHHTLSLYIKDGYQSFLKTPHGWRNGGRPDRLCLMPKDYSSVWDIRGAISFVHFYFTDQHLSDVAESVWDKSPYGLSIDERIFADDPQITTLYRQFLLNLSWHDSADRLALSSASTLLLTHLVRHYTNFKWHPLPVTGGLAPFQLARVKGYIDANLSANIQLSDLAAVANLSEYHFARMFKQSAGLTPHQYVMQQRLLLAKTLLKKTDLSLVTIALQCGFSSSGHFSNRFKLASGCTPSQYRQNYITR
ncbi:AraC family transcriptional regulator [Vibrio gazogenes]|uniref:AraC family transcriptional regulator n=1 Tax=Vibrio gazogenes TaxID=687 RepID=A0A1Z2SH95_VIBGA|nr:helix-turn-helix domain-containing protein [Vibrio gazogenes]ASA56538.1 AraC family transcriptional regulator [Vibrio gazogenes]